MKRRSFFAGTPALLLPASGFAAPVEPDLRAAEAFNLRLRLASRQRDLGLMPGQPNLDETAIPGYAACFTKGLPHDSIGQVIPSAYQQYLASLAQGRLEDLSRIPMGGSARLVNPMASFTFNLEGADSHSLSMNPAPAFSGSATAAEMVELYWMAICRDVPFADYSRSPLIRQAAQELSGLAAYPAARERGEISPNTIFRPAKSHCIAGPYISQLLLKPFPVSDNYLPQMWRFAMPGRDFMTQTASWLAVQNGSNADALPLEQSRRFIRNGRDLASYVHKDYSFQIFLHAALILLDSFPGAMLPTSPYRNVVQNQAGFSTFGGPFVCDLVAKAANAALKAAWFQKWLLHRRLRPEEMAGRVHFARSGAAQYPIHPSLLSSKAVDATFERHGSYLLPQAYPEGSPLHPSYPSGHGAVAGACATVLKALCHGEAIFASPVEPSPDGYTLNSHVGVPLTLGGEIDKLAYNVAFGRNWAGIHYWSDAIDGLLLGEQVAIHLLQDSLSCCQEATLPFAFTGFNGNQISIAKS